MKFKRFGKWFLDTLILAFPIARMGAERPPPLYPRPRPVSKSEKKLRARILSVVLGPDMAEFLEQPDSPLSREGILRLILSQFADCPETIERTRKYVERGVSVDLAEGKEPQKNPKRMLAFRESQVPDQTYYYVMVVTEHYQYLVFIDIEFRLSCVTVMPPYHGSVPLEERWWLQVSRWRRLFPPGFRGRR